MNKPLTIKTLNSEVFWSLAHTKWLSGHSKRGCRIQVDLDLFLTFTISSNGSFSDNIGQNSWDKSQNCTTSVFDSVPPATPVQCWLNQTPFDHPSIELGGKGDEKVLNVSFHLDILGNMTKTQKFASVPIYFDQDCLKMVVNK